MFAVIIQAHGAARHTVTLTHSISSHKITLIPVTTSNRMLLYCDYSMLKRCLTVTVSSLTDCYCVSILFIVHIVFFFRYHVHWWMLMTPVVFIIIALYSSMSCTTWGYSCTLKPVYCFKFLIHESFLLHIHFFPSLLWLRTRCSSSSSSRALLVFKQWQSPIDQLTERVAIQLLTDFPPSYPVLLDMIAHTLVHEQLCPNYNSFLVLIIVRHPLIL